MLIETKDIDPCLDVVLGTFPLFSCLAGSIKVLFKLEVYRFEGLWRHIPSSPNLRGGSASFPVLVPPGSVCRKTDKMESSSSSVTAPRLKGDFKTQTRPKCGKSSSNSFPSLTHF